MYYYFYKEREKPSQVTKSESLANYFEQPGSSFCYLIQIILFEKNRKSEKITL
jgi:hypothetical protein